MDRGTGVSVLNLLGLLLGAWVQLGIIRIMLALVDGKKPSYQMFKENKDIYVTYVVASVLVGFMVAIGFILLVVPGILIALAVGYYGYRVVDAKAGIIDSMKQSVSITKGHRLQLFGLALVCALLNIVGFLAIGFGLLWTIPTTMIAMAYVYRKLTSALEPVVVPAPSPRPAFLDGPQEAPAITSVPSTLASAV